MPNITYKSCCFSFYTTTRKRVVIFTGRYFKLSWNTTALSQSNCRNVSCNSIIRAADTENYITMPKCRTERLLRSFFPSTILTLNNRVCIDHISCMYDNFLFLLDLAGALTTLSSNGAFASNSLIIWPKTVSKVAIIKTKSAAIAFFSSPPFLLLALSAFLFLRYYIWFWSFWRA